MISQVDHPILEVFDLTVSYDSEPALLNANFGIPKGKMVGIVGPNGAGKSTLLKSVMGLVDNVSGLVKVFNKNLSQVRSRVAYVPQKESVDWSFPATVLDVVEMGRYGNKNLFTRLKKQDKEIAAEALAQVEMLEFSERHISQLSGGQQQRVFIARALAQEADIYFLDEPFSGIDVASEKTIFDILINLQKSGKTIFVVHHDLQSARAYFDWIILINKRIISSGPVGDVFTPELLQQTYGSKFSLTI
jgi:manganese/zinc/iron transport system ATP- binding protein